MSLSGRTVLITGGASGLGEACTRLFFKNGANVVILDINDETGNALCTELGSRVVFCKADVTSSDSVAAAVATAVSKFGGVHGVINSAGIGSAAKTANARGPHDLGLLKAVLDINLLGTLNVCRLVAAQMLKQQPYTKDGERGVILNTASVAAFEGQIGQLAYAASKGGVVSATIVLARDLSSFGIRANTIAPGIFQTPLMARAPESVLEGLAKTVTFPKRLGAPDEFARLALHLFDNNYINGETIRLDGAIRMAAM